MVLFDAMVLSRLDDTKEKVDRVLFDTGALSANYVSRRCFERFKSKIEDKDISRQSRSGKKSVFCPFSGFLYCILYDLSI
jgi:hypothetical protein